ncbi:hypothetical protein HW555_011035 [Spodoptera exigua]|uniref:Uncharacterized protein n=1 Tax=Spodoptera exigua TaxID=7107 RepID=A0A835KZ89_SPOEX|nr:hypothetical protein HW555_011035 [Spodoptera exigua]
MFNVPLDRLINVHRIIEQEIFRRKRYVHVNLDKLVFGSLRQQHKQSSIEDDEDSLKAIPFDDPPITSDDDDLNLDKTNASSKQTWFLNTKDLYDHIKISQDAPDLKDFIPKPVVNGSGWWYYNQADYVPLKNKRKYFLI